MGRESHCVCRVGGQTAEAKALLESKELILRGGVRRRIPLDLLREVQGTGCDLSFQVQGEVVRLVFPAEVAAAWAKRIAKPPVTIAAKLGIGGGTRVWFAGEPSSPELLTALSAAHLVSAKECQLAITEVTTPEQLFRVLRQIHNVPLWIVYPKGKGRAVSEQMVRETARELGWRDTKVASVSAAWTALRFIRPAQKD